MSILRYFQKEKSASGTEDVGASELQTSVSRSTSDPSSSGMQFSAVLTEANESDVSENDSLDEGSSILPPSPKRPLIDSTPECNDVAKFIGNSVHISDADKYKLLTNPFEPGASYVFPKGSSGRAFQFRWLQLYPWLAYSKEKNGGFCIPCVLFARTGYHGADPGVLVRSPLVSFSKALELLSKHAAKAYHKTAMVRADSFLQVMRNQFPAIQCQMNQAMADRIACNVKKLSSIVKTIVFCGRQNIALRGHRDNATNLESDATENHENFCALLHFRIEAGDTTLGDHLETASRNATYTSLITQNQLIQIICLQTR